MTDDELLKFCMDQRASDQQNYRHDMRAMQARMEARQARPNERWDAVQARSDERLDELKRDTHITIWSNVTVAAAVFGPIMRLLLAFVH